MHTCKNLKALFNCQRENLNYLLKLQQNYIIKTCSKQTCKTYYNKCIRKCFSYIFKKINIILLKFNIQYYC